MIYHIADSAVFIMNNHEFLSPKLNIITVPSVKNELKSKGANLRFNLLRVRMELPEQEMIKEVLKIVKYTQDADLSNTDIDILAKAFEYKQNGILLTDDYGVQNIAKIMGITIKPIMQKNIKDIIIWEMECIGCRKRFSKGDICYVCGSALKRKRKSKILQ